MQYYLVSRDSRSEWRWSFVAKNGRIIAVSSEGYKNKSDCLHAIDLVKGSYNAPVHER